MKHLFHIATGQFEFIEEEFEGTAEEAVEAYKSLTEAFRASQNAPEGLEAKVFDQVLDRYLSGKGMDAEAYGAMSKVQVDMVQTLKRSLARIKRRNEATNDKEIN